MVCAALSAMNPKRQSVDEAGAYRILKVVLTDLRKVERVLATNIENTPPDPDQAAYLAAIRAAIAKLYRLVASQNRAHYRARASTAAIMRTPLGRSPGRPGTRSAAGAP
jgi:hypothetical protein